MSEPSDTPESAPSTDPQKTLRLKYGCADLVRVDRLRDLPHGLLARTKASVAPGEAVDVQIEVEREKVNVSARAVVRWVTPLAKGSIVGMELVGAEHRDDVKLDLLLSVRGSLPVDLEALDVGTPVEVPEFAVAMLQPNRLLLQVIANALERFAQEKEDRRRLRLRAFGDRASFITSLSERRPDLAVIDCDGIDGCADPLVRELRSRESSKKVPLILLSQERSPRLEDRFTVTMQKPVAMKAFLDTADLLLRS